MRRWLRAKWDQHSWVLVLLGVGAALAGIVALRIAAWTVAHPDAPLWTFFLGGR